MNRRHFTTNFAAGFAGLAAAPRRGDAAGGTPRNSFYLLESLRLQQGSQRGRLDEFYTGTMLPALTKLKVAPPLGAEESHLEQFVEAVRTVIDLAHNSTGFWGEALGLARRAVNI